MCDLHEMHDHILKWCSISAAANLAESLLHVLKTSAENVSIEFNGILADLPGPRHLDDIFVV